MNKIRCEKGDKKLKILCLYAYFKPEIFASSQLQDDLLQGIANAGHTVEIVCPVPTRGIDKDTVRKYHKIKSENLYGNAVHVTRFYAMREKKIPLFALYVIFSVISEPIKSEREYVMLILFIVAALLRHKE